MKYKFIFCLLFLFLSFSFNKLYATHLRAGDITVRKINCLSNTYEFTVTLYLDAHPGNATQDDIFLNFGDGSKPSKQHVILPYGTIPNYPFFQINKFIFTHSYNNPGEYTAYIGEEDNNLIFTPGLRNRNDKILNINNSVQTPFYIETHIKIDPSFCDNSPIFTNPPTDQGRVGQKFTYDPAGYDIDGDSLSYSFVTPAQGLDRSGNILNVNGYVDPNVLSTGGISPKSEANGPATFTINPVTGLITWDSPAIDGQYNIAFVVTEWRKGTKGVRTPIGYVRRDMQIIINKCDNLRPDIQIPKDTCILANTKLLNIPITSTDPNIPAETLRDTSFGGVYTDPLNKATFSYSVPQKSKAYGYFSWTPNYAQVRSQPYTVVFKVENSSTDCKLSDTKAWNITVVAPKDSLYSAVPFSDNNGKSIKLTWAPYAITGVDLSTLKVIIYRKKGCDNFQPGYCETGMPPAWGYTRISDTSALSNFYVDKKNLQKGVIYSYRIVIAFPEPNGGVSYVSNPVCVTLAKDLPFITNVSVKTTDKKTGNINIAWTHPPEFNTVNYPGPYQYQVFRSDGQNGTNYIPVGSRINVKAFPNYSNVGPKFTRQNGFSGIGTAYGPDTTFTDNGLNTLEKSYNYIVAIYYNTNNFKDSSAYASSVWLNTAPAIKSVKLNWQYDVPWDNSNQYHKIYKKNKNNAFILLDSVKVNLPSDAVYIDNGSKDTTLVTRKFYCYYIETKGKYVGISLNPILLLNNSQIACETVKDTTRPCPPKLSLDSLDCINYKKLIKDGSPPLIQNELSWINQKLSYCDTIDISKYNLYYAQHSNDSLKFLATTSDKFYIHFNVINNIRSLAGCYAVTAIDRSGNESILSNIVCVDNCPNYDLPNIITPDGSIGFNDTFRPFKEPAFVESVKFTVYNRWGKQVFEKSSDIFIHWDGKEGIPEKERNELSSGIYYYHAEVKFIRLRRQDSIQHFKGWIQILR